MQPSAAGTPADSGPLAAPSGGLTPLPEADAKPSLTGRDITPVTSIDAGRLEESPSAADDLYRQDRLLRVDLTVDLDAWEKIRREGRSLADVYTGCAFSKPFEYTSVPASVVIDGHAFDEVGVRKKGFIGSLATINPSLRIDLAHYTDSQKLFGEKVITLNNALSDTSLLRQCLAYRVFAKAGLPAPRCNFAAVTVNGSQLGIYVHVEAVKKPMLQRTLRDDEGDLYEGVLGDFRPDRIKFLEKKTHEQQPISAELEALTLALTKPDDQMLRELAPVIDLDGFIRYWATEALINHEDSYSGNQNNFFVYVHSVTRKLHFIPWGTDGTFKADSDVMTGRPATTYATARLTRRLWAIPAVQEKYRATLGDLLRDVWNEAELTGWLDAMQRLLGDAPHAAGVREVRAFIEHRRALLDAELGMAPKPWPFAERGELRCDPTRRIPVDGSFATVWETSTEFPTLALPDTVAIALPSQSLATLLILSNAAPTGDGRLGVGMVMSQLDGSLYVLQLLTTRKTLEIGELPFHGFETFGVLLKGPSADQLKILGFISDGSIRFDQMQMKPGESVAGSFNGVFTYNNRAWE